MPWPLQVTVRSSALSGLFNGDSQLAFQEHLHAIEDRLVAGDLRIVLEEHEPAPRPINIVHREGRHASAKVRAFVDLIAARLRADRA